MARDPERACIAAMPASKTWRQNAQRAATAIPARETVPAWPRKAPRRLRSSNGPAGFGDADLIETVAAKPGHHRLDDTQSTDRSRRRRRWRCLRRVQYSRPACVASGWLAPTAPRRPMTNVGARGPEDTSWNSAEREGGAIPFRRPRILICQCDGLVTSWAASPTRQRPEPGRFRDASVIIASGHAAPALRCASRPMGEFPCPGSTSAS